MIETEGRDKVCKMIQYASRFIKYQATGNNQTVEKAFQGLSGKLRETQNFEKTELLI